MNPTAVKLNWPVFLPQCSDPTMYLPVAGQMTSVSTLALSWDCQSADVFSDGNYNWFAVACSYENRTYTYANTRLQWDPFYRNIYIANGIIKTIPPDTDNETTKAYRGVALAFRAWDYMNLVQFPVQIQRTRK